MKKLSLFIAAGMVFFGIKLYAGESVSAPYGEVSNPINADYGGVDYSTSQFSSAVTTVAPINQQSGGLGYGGFFVSSNTVNNRTRYRIYGVNFSTGACFDYANIYVSTGMFNTPNNSAVNNPSTGNGVLRVYNVVGSTGSGLAGSTCSGLSFFRWPVRVYGNLFWNLSNSGYNSAQLMYWKEPD